MSFDGSFVVLQMLQFVMTKVVGPVGFEGEVIHGECRIAGDIFDDLDEWGQIVEDFGGRQRRKSLQEKKSSATAVTRLTARKKEGKNESFYGYRGNFSTKHNSTEKYTHSHIKSTYFSNVCLTLSA